jgi:hypothetical protein
MFSERKVVEVEQISEEEVDDDTTDEEEKEEVTQEQEVEKEDLEEKEEIEGKEGKEEVEVEEKEVEKEGDDGGGKDQVRVKKGSFQYKIGPYRMITTKQLPIVNKKLDKSLLNQLCEVNLSKPELFSSVKSVFQATHVDGICTNRLNKKILSDIIHNTKQGKIVSI